MSKEYPLFPELSKEAQIEAQELINKFKIELAKSAESAISDFYCDIMPYIESDTWTNFKNELMAGFKEYGNRKIQGEYDFKEIRQSILKNHKEDIIKDLNQDMVEEIKELKNQLDIAWKHNH